MIEEKINKIISKEGAIRGEAILKCISFIQREKGKVGLQKLTDTLEQLNVSTNIKEIKDLDWVDGSLLTVVLILSKDLFDWTDRDIVEMGMYAPKNSKINKFFLDCFNSPDSLSKIIPDYWQKMSKVGHLEVTDNKENQITITLSDYDYDSLNCLFISGLLQTLYSLTIDGSTKVVEKKCLHNNKDEKVHQFLISW